jgi:hypothetical protein
MIAALVQSIQNQFIAYDCKNKLCTCQPILLIFFGNNLFCQKDDIRYQLKFVKFNDLEERFPVQSFQNVSAYRSKGKKSHSKWVLKCSKPRSFSPWTLLGGT